MTKNNASKHDSTTASVRNFMAFSPAPTRRFRRRSCLFVDRGNLARFRWTAHTHSLTKLLVSGNHRQQNMRRVFGGMMKLVFRSYPLRLIVIVTAGIQVAVEARKVAARNLYANAVARRKVIACDLQINLHFVDFTRLHPYFPDKSFTMSGSQDSLLHVVGDTVRVNIHELDRKVGVPRRGRDIEHRLKGAGDLDTLLERFTGIHKDILAGFNLRLIEAPFRRIGRAGAANWATTRRSRRGRIVGVFVDRFLLSHSGVKRARAQSAVGMPIAVQKIFGEASPSERPFMLGAPEIPSHNV